MTDLILTEELELPATKSPRDRWLGIMASMAVAWYIFSLMVFVAMLSLNTNSISSLYTAEQLSYLTVTPFWTKFAHVVSIFSGLIGSAYLLLRRQNAYYWFAACLVALMLIKLDASLRGGFEIMGASLMGISLTEFLIGIYLFWAAYSAKRQGELSTT
ncbi:hypothetical protein [Hellea balneolensis]|uniref:hypothetical protein n=1 Tax=Hellea balneolensis TaxID=287478 RepID=UPI0003F5F7A7|nr:hypothetical protein [Hellea balneolensis]